MKKLLLLLVLAMIFPTALRAQTLYVSTGLEQAVAAGEIVALDVQADASVPFSVYEKDGQIYGVTDRLFQRRMMLGEEALFARVGAKAPAPDWTWTDFLALADAVRAYRAASGETVYLLREEIAVPLFVEALLGGAQADAHIAEEMLAAYKALYDEGLIWRIGDAHADEKTALLITREIDYLSFAQVSVIPAPADFGGPISITARMQVRRAGAETEPIAEPEPQLSGAMPLHTTIEQARACWSVENISPPTPEELAMWLDGLARGVLVQEDESRKEKRGVFGAFMDGTVSAADCAAALCRK